MLWQLLVISTISIVTCWASYEVDIRSRCGFTRYPSLCFETLAELGSSGYQNLDFMSTLVNKTISETELSLPNFKQIHTHFVSQEAHPVRMAIDNCHDVLAMSVKWLNRALDALKESPRKHKEDIQTWLSAAITFQQACKDEIEVQLSSNVFLSEISKKMDYLSELAGNPLSLMNQNPAKSNNKFFTGQHFSEDKIFPGWVSASDKKQLQTSQIKPNVTVAKDGSANYEKISDAIEAASGKRFVIYVKSGVYNENSKDGMTLIGDGKYSTIITASRSVAGGSTLRNTATFSIIGAGFIARDIGFQNTAGPQGAQAVALFIASDHSVLYRCSISGYQDTLYAANFRQFYRECDIQGTIDFVFGNANAVFQKGKLILHRPADGAYNVILAQGQTDLTQNLGFCTQNCQITVSSDFAPVKRSYRSYLGRPWKQFLQAVVMESSIDDAIVPQGSIEWPGANASTYKTLYFAEYENIGPGAGTSARVKWPGFHVIGEAEAEKFTVANFISGSQWLPSTGVPFIPGLH